MEAYVLSLLEIVKNFLFSSLCFLLFSLELLFGVGPSGPDVLELLMFSSHLYAILLYFLRNFPDFIFQSSFSFSFLL